MANYQYINTTGTVIADTGDILGTVQAEFQKALGNDLIVTPDTPQGVLITGETTARSNFVKNNADVSSQINPNLAGGVFLDAIGALTGLDREVATPSVVIGVTLAGVAGTIVPAGTQVQTSANDIFATTATVVLNSSGNGTAIFQAIENGPIPCAIGALTQIVTGPLGLETVYNSTAATLGTNVQTDQSYRALRKVTLAGQGVSLPEAMISALYKVNGVTSLTFRENITASTATIDGISMVAHSIYACVKGGTDLDVATAILEKKSGGCNWNGGTSVVVVEPSSGQSYTVKFDRPTAIPFKVKATVSVASSLIDATTAVPAAIFAYVNGQIEGEPGLIIGQDVSTFELAGAVTTLNPGIYVSNMQTSVDGGTTWVNTPISVGINQIATIGSTDVTVVIV